MATRHPFGDAVFGGRYRSIPMQSVNPLVASDEIGQQVNPPFSQPDQQQIIIASLPVYLYPSADSQAFDYVKYVAFPAEGADAVIIDFPVPAGMNGIIKRFGNVFVGAGFTEGTSALYWQLLADGQPIPNYENIPASLGATANPSEVSSIRIKAGQRIQLVVHNVSLVGGGYYSGGRLGGWFYPQDQEPQGTWAAG
jgi:hypothetical protein